MMKRAIVMALASAALMFNVASRADETVNKNWPSPIHDNPVYSKFMLDRLEVRDTKEGNMKYFEGQAYIGTDLNKLWLKSEGSVVKNTTEDADLEALYSRAVAPYWDVQVGMRHDFSVNNQPSRDWAAFALKGLAPYFFDVDASAYVGSNGRTAARLSAEYDLLFTQRLILTPQFEGNLYGKKDPARGLGSGLSDVEFGLRLRYEIRREFAPYIGVVWARKYGGTADMARSEGIPVEDTQVVVGVRSWW